MPKSWGSVARRGANVVRQTDSKAKDEPPKPSGPPAPQDEWVLLEDEVLVSAEPAAEQRRPAPEVPGDVAAAIRRSASEATAYRREKLVEQMGRAAEAYDRHRFEEAARLASRLADVVPDVVAVRELAGLACYRAAIWRGAYRHLEAYRLGSSEPQYLPLEMDAARALGKKRRVEELFEELRQESPDPDTLAEGRIVLAGSLADRGKLAEAIALLEANGAAKPRRNPGERHLRQWYLLGDLYDRSGDVPRARSFFSLVATADPGAYDVADRLKELGPARSSSRRR
jgi:tetratricopeptide (TPR) repeat protein